MSEHGENWKATTQAQEETRKHVSFERFSRQTTLDEVKGALSRQQTALARRKLAMF
jgi:hypothetical protein